MKKNKPSVWQTKPTLIEHLRRCGTTLDIWLKNHDVQDEARMLEICNELELIPPNWTYIGLPSVKHKLALAIDVDKALVEPFHVTENQIEPTNDVVSQKKKRVKQVVIADEQLPPCDVEIKNDE